MADSASTGLELGLGLETLHNFRGSLTTRNNSENLSDTHYRIPTVSSEAKVRKVPGTTESTSGRTSKEIKNIVGRPTSLTIVLESWRRYTNRHPQEQRENVTQADSLAPRSTREWQASGWATHHRGQPHPLSVTYF